MIRVVIGSVAVLAFLVVCNSAHAEKEWMYTMTTQDKTEKVVEKGVFTAADGKLFKGKDRIQIGTYKEMGKTVIMEVTKGELKGETELKFISNNPDIYKGELTRPDGKKYNIAVIIK